MFTKVCLLTCALLPVQVGSSQTWQFSPLFARGQEVVYQGIYKEKSLVPGVAFQRDYRLQMRLFVLEADKDGWEVAILTAVELLPDGPGSAPFKPAKLGKASIQMELARIDKQGKVRALDQIDLSPPLDGPPTTECGFVIPAPELRVGVQQQWSVTDPGRPAQVWKAVGTETIAGARCALLHAVQESPNWKDTQAAGGAWQRSDKVWFNPQLGLAVRVERAILRRDPARTVPTHAGTLHYDLVRQWTYPPGHLFEARKQDIRKGLEFARKAEQLLTDHLRHKKELDLLITQAKQYVEQKDPVEPYRQVFAQVLHRIDAVRKGEIVVKQQVVERPLIPAATPGQRVPDFVVSNLTGKGTVRLYEQLGRPLLIIFYNPHTSTGYRTLQYGRRVSKEHEGKVNVLALAVSHRVDEVQQQHRELALKFPILDGTGLHHTFGVDATPRLVVLDGDGVLRAAYTGWSPLVAEQVLADLQKCAPAKKAPNP